MAGDGGRAEKPVDLAAILREEYGEPDQVRRGEAGKLQAFLAHADIIRAALEDGYSIRVVHQAMVDKGLFEGSYNAFTGYVRNELGIVRGRARLTAEERERREQRRRLTGASR